MTLSIRICKFFFKYVDAFFAGSAQTECKWLLKISHSYIRPKVSTPKLPTKFIRNLVVAFKPKAVVKGKVKFSLCLTKHRAVKAY
jgi:hypothetical protein